MYKIQNVVCYEPYFPNADGSNCLNVRDFRFIRRFRDEADNKVQ